MKIFTKKRILIALPLILIGGYFYNSSQKNKVIEYKSQIIEMADIIEKVSVTGKVKPIDTTHLTFEQSGKIREVYARVGDKVTAGDVLVELTSQELLAQKQEALANLKKTQVHLKELQNGTRVEEVQVQQSKYVTSGTSVKNAEQDLAIKIQEAFVDSNFIITNTIANLSDNPRDPRTKILFTTNDSVGLHRINNDKFFINKMNTEWKNYLLISSDVRDSKKVAETNLKQLKYFVNDLITFTPSIRTSHSGQKTRLEDWKKNMATTQQTINAAISEIDQAYNKLLTEEQNKVVSKNELHLKNSGVRIEQVEMQEASVWAASARVQQTQAQIDKTFLKAPFNGTVTKMEAKKGEVISLASSKEILVSMIGEGYEIELNVPEVDISKIKIGDTVVIKFDAFSDHEFESKVKFIEPAETEVSGVVYYQVKIELDLSQIDLKIRSGMSVDVDIITDKKENVIKVPQRKVIRQDGDKIVRILEPNPTKGEDIVEVSVETGIRDSEGNIEILSGLELGDKLLLE